MIFEIWSSLFLIICAVIDLKTKKVYQSICLMNYGLAVGIKLFIYDMEPMKLVTGIVLCGILFSISVITKEAIGKGDVLIVLTLTGILNVINTLEILFAAIFICSVFSVVMLITKKMKRKDAIPFVPFLLAGYCVWIITGGRYV